MVDKSAPSASQIRKRFIEFFEARGHTAVPSSSLVPKNDPTLLFVNAGMNQFKDVFTGREERPYSRAVTVQRCLRAGGKHNDLDNVGFTPRHQTMFEMLGNFSFGDYFKAEAIEWGWKFLTEDLGIPAQRLCVTVFDGTGENAPPDDEAAELWARFVPPERIFACSAKDNFWQMGDTGPCGPCSEIHLYAGEVAPGDAGKPGKGPAYEDDKYLELWNLVFMQYEKQPDGSLQKLPKPSIDTGAGLERLAAAVAEQPSNYHTDVLAPLVAKAKKLAGVTGVLESEAPFRVIADHARATAFLIADGVFPGNNGREYVLRRIMRRAIRHGREAGIENMFFHEVCDDVVTLFSETYPVLADRRATISKVVQGEEEAFRRTLDRGLRHLRNAIERLEDGQKAFPPPVAAELYDTYGFPIDLTGVIVAEHGLTLDEGAAEDALRERQGGTAGRGSKLGGDQKVSDLYFELHGKVGDSLFVGYAQTEADAQIQGLIVDGASVPSVEASSDVEVVLDQTPMYAESGGQIGDSGTIVGEGFEIEVRDCRKPVGKLHVHAGRVVSGSVKVGQKVQVRVDQERRAATARNHSATHLLHHALRAELGEHVMQKGSLVAPDRLRFDYSHNRPLTPEQWASIERRVNQMILKNVATGVEEMSTEDAKARGAIGLFEAKYGEKVRVVSIAGDSVELCGGTHVARAGDIGSFAIVSEGGVAQGVRRVEAVTGMGAILHLQHLVEVASGVTGALHAQSFDDVPERVSKLQAELKAKDREIERLAQKLATGGAGASEEVLDVDGVKLMARKVAVADPKALRSAADTLRDRLGSGVVVLGAEAGGKAMLLVAVTKDLQSKVHAGKLVGALAAHVEGRGGGRPDLAQAGGPKLAGLDDALNAAGDALGTMLRAS